MAEKFRFGIIGCGVIAPTHGKAIASLPDAELIAVADRNPEKAQEIAQNFHARAYTDAQEMLDKERLDVADVCTPSGLHGEHACQIMRAGCHVIIEKPMEITHERINEQIAVLQSEHIHYLELHGIWDINILDLSDQQIEEVRQALRVGGIGVAAIGSPIGKVPINFPFEEHMQRFERTAR